jgi:transposase
LEGHNQAFAYFSGVPRTILYDNTRIAVKEILGDGERKPTQAFSELQSHCLFAVKFGRPGKGNDKGNVEGLVGGREKVMTKETWRDWWATRGGTSWSRCLAVG